MANSISDKCPFDQIIRDTFVIGYGEDTFHAALRSMEAWLKEHGLDFKRMDKDEQLEYIQHLGMHLLKQIEQRINQDLAATLQERYEISKEDVANFTENQALERLFKGIFGPPRRQSRRSADDVLAGALDELLRSRFRF